MAVKLTNVLTCKRINCD